MTLDNVLQKMQPGRTNPAGKQQNKAIIRAFNQVIVDALTAGNSVFIRGFGTFSPQKRAAKPAVNLKTMEKIMIPAHVVPVFKPSPDMKARNEL